MKKNKHPLLYIITEGDRGPVKVGISHAPAVRAMELQTGNSRQLTLYWCHPYCSRGDARFAERAAHRCLDQYRLGGEWFDLSPIAAACLLEGAVI